jgi:hypothetical protein
MSSSALPVGARATAPALPAASHDEPSLLSPLGWMPALSLVGAAGLLCLAAVNRISAAGGGNLEGLYWLSLAIVTVPIMARLLVRRASRPERLGLVLVIGLYLYLVKVLQSPFAFTYGDEFMHVFNVNQILQTAHLYSANSLLPASSLYPGLEAATASLLRLSGLDTFTGGLVIIGLARLLMMLSLFLLYEQLSHSARVASLGAALYAANANFVYWSAQFSYESLALPLATLVLFVVARRQAARQPAERLGLTLVAVALVATVVVTHHLASYFLAGALACWALVAGLERWMITGSAYRLLEQPWRVKAWASLCRVVRPFAGRPARPTYGELESGGPSGLAWFAVLAVLFWLFFVANLTLSYLSPVFGTALNSILNWIGGEATSRTLFQSGTGVTTSLLERATGYTAVLLCLLGLPFGLRQVWRRGWHNPPLLFLAASSVAYFAALGLRFLPSAWEISNRSSEFLFIGLALVLAMSHFPVWAGWRHLVRLALVPAAAIILAGGIIAGWPPNLRLTRVYRVAVSQQSFEPVGLSMTRWILAHLGPNHNFAADQTNGRFLLVYGQQNVLLGQNRSAEEILERPGPSLEDVNLLREDSIDYVLVDRRVIADDTMAGFFFETGPVWPLPASALRPAEVYEKFDQSPQVNRLADGGDLVLYDVRAITGAAAQP